MANAVRFKQNQVPRQPSELVRFKVIQGPDYGAVYVVTGPKASIGRGEENDIIISDLKSSRVHAEVIGTQSGWIVRDKGSSNGILYNGNAAREAKLKINDTITIGETTLEFTTSEVGTMMLIAPPRTMDQVRADQKNLQDHQNKLRSMGMGSVFGNPTQTGGAAGPGQNKLRPILIGAVGLAFLFFMGDDGQQVQKPKSKKKDDSEARDLAKYLPQVEGSRAAETLFKEGFREYLAGNYNRARTQFETVLQISPGHVLAIRYLENCQKDVEKDVKRNLASATKSLGAGKLKDAFSHYKRVMQLLERDQANPDYVLAKEQCLKVEKDMNGGGKCLRDRQ